jgi:Asp-tRNA(Asn)/Glu-tRNA(Gln) amidotransferase A subunit family amidase
MTNSEPRSKKRLWIVFSVVFIWLFLTSIFFNIRHWMVSTDKHITEDDVRAAAKVVGLKYTGKEIELMMEDVEENLEAYKELRTHPLDNAVFPAIHLNPLYPFVDAPPVSEAVQKKTIQLPDQPGLTAPKDLEELAFAPVTVLARLIKTRQVTSTDLTKMYLRRLKKYGPSLECVVTLTEDLAMEQAARADREIAEGKYRGPLHGIPWGAKDLLATKGIKTTWGAMPYASQVLNYDATVVKRLEDAGAVLVAKLSMGALAWGDVWFGGTTKNPWNMEQGSSGSSAGPGSATAAGLVGFSIGTETWGSIVSPSNRCGVTGLRPTYGRVSRYGAMALSWTFDKIGPMCRTVEDCALVFNEIYGPDHKDFTVLDKPFEWDRDLDIKTLRIGYVKALFEKEYENKANDAKVLETLRGMGVQLITVELPEFPVGSLAFILNAEAAAAFDELTRSNKDDLMKRQVRHAWPNTFRYARLIPAVEYIQANRFRGILMQKLAKALKDIDVYVVPSFGGSHLLMTNLTGQPAVVVPNGFNDKKSPTSITFMGKLFGEANALAAARAYQEAAGFHKMHPDLDEEVKRIRGEEDKK